MHILIAGAGAMGSRFALSLRKAGNDVTLLDLWPANINEIRFNGMSAIVNGQKVHEEFPIYGPEDIGHHEMPADLLIVFVKCYQLDKIFPSIQSLLTDHTYTLCLMNGLGLDDIMEKYIPKDHILLGSTTWNGRLNGPGRPVLEGNGRVFVQNLCPSSLSFCQKVISLLNEADMNAEYAADLRSVLYKKACLAGVVNTACTLLECNLNELIHATSAHRMAIPVVHEFALVAEKEGVHLDEQEIHESIRTYAYENRFSFTSMYQDLIEAHRITEIDAINGAVCRKGRQYHIQTPCNDMIVSLIHAKEELLNAF